MKVSARIEALDGLRFIACLMVILYHYFFASPQSGFLPKEYAIHAFFFGDFGVDLFFLISGFVISLSSDGRTPFGFIKSRINRIVPTFIIFGLIIFIFSISIPMVDPSERIITLLYSFTFFPQVFGYPFFSDIFWTIQCEVTFYIWVYFLMLSNIWGNFKKQICFIWISLSFFNQFILHSSILNHIFLTEYAGHFIAGIIIYNIKKNKCMPFDVVLILFSIILIYNRMVIFNDVSLHLFKYQVSNVSLLLSALCIVVLVWYASKIDEVGKYYNFVKFLGAMTYPLYLIHADIGFWSHAIFERSWWHVYPITKNIVSYDITIMIAVFVSFFISAIYIKYFDKIITRFVNRVWEVGENFYKKI